MKTNRYIHKLEVSGGHKPHPYICAAYMVLRGCDTIRKSMNYYMGTAPTSQSSFKNRVTRCSPGNRCFIICLRMKRTETEMVKLLDMKDRDLQCRGYCKTRKVRWQFNFGVQYSSYTCSRFCPSFCHGPHITVCFILGLHELFC